MQIVKIIAQVTDMLKNFLLYLDLGPNMWGDLPWSSLDLAACLT